MKPTIEQIIDWGRTALNETGALIPAEWNMELLEAICSAAYEAGRREERDACAAVCDKLGDEYADANPADCAFVIRERGAP